LLSRGGFCFFAPLSRQTFISTSSVSSGPSRTDCRPPEVAFDRRAIDSASSP
jgi:hypothetical protein